MEIGLIFALLGSVAFAGSIIFTRRGVFYAGESFTTVAITIFMGTIFFLLLIVITWDWVKLWNLSWRSFALLGGAGVAHFLLGRLLAYNCYRLIGATRGSPILRTQIFYAVIFGVVLLKETLTLLLVLGVLCIAAGATLVSIDKGDGVTKISSKGILAGLGGAFFWGTSGVLVKPAMQEIGSPYAAVFISFLAASIVIAGFFFSKGQREQLFQLRRESLIPIMLSGIFSAVAQLLRYAAFSYSPVSVVQPIMGTSVIFTLFFSYLLNRNIEVFTWRVIAGTVVTAIGTALLFY